jgi:hypothetical protein
MKRSELVNQAAKILEGRGKPKLAAATRKYLGTANASQLVAKVAKALTKLAKQDSRIYQRPDRVDDVIVKVSKGGLDPNQDRHKGWRKRRNDGETLAIFEHIDSGTFYVATLNESTNSVTVDVLK